MLKALSILPLLLSGLAPAQKLEVLIFSGHNNHDWRSSTPFLKKVLLDSGRFDVRVDEEPAGATEKTLAPYQVLVLDYVGPRWGEATERAVENFVKSGKGLVLVHGASYPFGEAEVLGERQSRTGRFEPPWLEYRKMVGAYWSRKDQPVTGHGQRHSFRVKFADRSHPIAQGMDETFWATDELYHSFRMLPGVHVLATAFDDPKFGGTGKEEPLLWTVSYGQGRVFHTALGHNLAALQETGFITTFARGTEWAATGAVTLPPKPAPAARSPRVLVVTGGHDYDSTFYSLFDGLSWTHALNHHQAYKTDIRPKYDVLVLYDLEQDISDQEQKNLRDFVEGGKGVVVLHHALADYQNWEWWYKEVVGGKYLLKGSTFQHDLELFVEPVARHPVVGDIGPLHIWDEGYKGMWISPNVKVLLRTNHPASDGPVAWISPYDKSRVVVIQLGHDRAAHVHAGYRQLVRNAITWSAAR